MCKVPNRNTTEVDNELVGLRFVPETQVLQNMLFNDKQKKAAACFAAFVSILVYLPSIWADFTYDDKVAVKTNPDVQLLLPPSQIFKHDFWGNNIIPEGPGQWTHHSYRPLVVLTFQLDQLIGNGSPAIFHLSNILIHAAVTLFCGSFLFSLWGPGHFMLPTCATLLFAVHPVHTEVVANVTSRAETVAALFMLYGLARLAFRLRMERRQKPQKMKLVFYDVVIPSVCAVLCKEVALVFPIAAIWVYLMATPATKQMSGLFELFTEKLQLCKSKFVGMCLAFTALQYFVRIQMLSGGYDVNAAPVHNPIQFLDGLAKPMSYAYVQALAMSMTILPWFMSHEHNALPPLLSVYDPRNLLTVAFWLVVLGLLLWAQSCTLEDPFDKRAPASEMVEDVGLLGRLQSECTKWMGASRGDYCWSKGVGYRCLLGLGVMAIFYGPASHIMVTVAFVLAERTLFLPTVGSVIVLTEAIALLSMFVSERFDKDWSCLWPQGDSLVDALVQNWNECGYECNLDELQPLDEVLSMDELRQLWGCFCSKRASGMHLSCKPTEDQPQPAMHEVPRHLAVESVGPIDTKARSPEGHIARASESVLPLVSVPCEGVAPGVRFVESVLRKEAKKEKHAARCAREKPSSKKHLGCKSHKPPAGSADCSQIVRHPDSLPQRNKTNPHSMHDADPTVERSSGSIPTTQVSQVGFQRTFAVFLSCLLATYTYKLHSRQMQWQNEDVLLQSCLDMYPDNNFMTVYGIGTRKLYTQDLVEAERLLLRAHEMSPTIAEPAVLLSQLYWKYGPNVTDSVSEGNKKAIHYLQLVKTMHKRNEFQTNLGILLSQVAQTAEEQETAQHAVLYAEAAHTLRPGSRMMGPVLHNAACVRLLAAPNTFGSIAMAQAAAERAAETQYDERGVGLHNLAVIHAVQGHVDDAQMYARQSLATGYQGLVPVTSIILTPQAEATMRQFAQEQQEPLAGATAQARLNALGLACASSLLWF